MEKESHKFLRRFLKGFLKVRTRIFALALALVTLCAGETVYSEDRGSQLTARLVNFTGYGGVSYIKKEGYYVNIYGENGEIAEVRYKEGGSTQRMYYLMDPDTGAEQTAYCLASGLSFRNGAAYGAGSESAGSFSDYYDILPETAKRGIAYASIYGYDSSLSSPDAPGPVSGTLGADFWMATQCVIWEYQQGIRTDAGERRNVGLVEADNFYSMICGKPAEKCYDYLLNLIKNAAAVPSFGGDSESGWSYTVTLRETAPHTSRYTTSIYCSAALLAGDYYATDSSGNELTFINISLSGRMMNITSTVSLEDGMNIIVRRRDVNDGEGASVFFSPEDPGQQTMLSAYGKLSDPYGLYLSLKTQDDNNDHIIFRIEKDSDDGAVAGIPFVYCWTDRDRLFYDRTVYTDSEGVSEAWFTVGANPGDISSSMKYVAVAEPYSPGYDFSISGYSGNTNGGTLVYMYRKEQNGSVVWAYSINESGAMLNSIDGEIYPGYFFGIRSSSGGDTATINISNRRKCVSLEIEKQIYADEFIPAHGDAVFIFKITHEETGDEYYRSVVFTAENKAPGLQVLSKTVSLTDLTAGTYRVEELKTLRYEKERLEVGVSSPAGEDDEGVSCSEDGSAAMFTLLTNGSSGHALFVNGVINQEKTSHTAYCENIFDFAGRS